MRALTMSVGTRCSGSCFFLRVCGWWAPPATHCEVCSAVGSGGEAFLVMQEPFGRVSLPVRRVFLAYFYTFCGPRVHENPVSTLSIAKKDWLLEYT